MSLFNPLRHERISRRRLLKHGTAGLVASGVALGSGTGQAKASPAAQTPVPDDRIAQAVAALDTLAQESLARTGVPGIAIAVVHNDRQIFAKGYGVRDSAGSDPVDADTVFRLASVSKSLASTVTAALVGDGKVGWDDRISAIMPEVELSEPWISNQVTIRDCLCHRTGVPDGGGDVNADLGYDRDQLLYRLRFLRPDSSFRSRYGYNNISYTLGNVAAARAAGLTWEDACVERLYAPLGMSRTSTTYQAFLNTPNHATEHQRVDGKWVYNGPSEDDAEAPAGNASSSVNDLSRWVRLHLGMGAFEGRQLIPAAALGETHRPQVATAPADDPNTPPQFYGLGLDVSYRPNGSTQISHSGAFNMGTATTVYMLPGEQLGIIVLSNAQPIGLVEGVALSFLDYLGNGKLTRDWVGLLGEIFAQLVAATIAKASPHDYATPPANPTPALPLAAYVGRYSNDYYGDAAIVEQDGGLALQLGPRPTVYALAHYDHDVWTFLPRGENAWGISGATFTIGASGQAATVMFDNMNMEGQGTFVRSPD